MATRAERVTQLVSALTNDPAPSNAKINRYRDAFARAAGLDPTRATNPQKNDALLDALRAHVRAVVRQQIIAARVIAAEADGLAEANGADADLGELP